MKITRTALQIALAAALGAAAFATHAQNAGSGYLQDARGAPAKSGAGLCWRTGYWSPAMATAECDPALVKKPEPPKAAQPAKPAPPPPPAAPKKCDFSYTLQADETFAFNKADLNAAAKAKLDSQVIAKFPSCSAVRLILVTGHTDRLGKPDYNQKLSEKRADSVKAYLVTKGMKPDQIETMGAGKTQAVPGVKCDDRLKRQELIKCLAPNRRVTIDVQGTAK